MTAEQPEPEAARQRMFLALWPDPEVSAALAEWAQAAAEQTGGRAVAMDNLHITVVFLGALLPAQVEAVRECAAAMARIETVLYLDRVGFWARRGLVWAGSSRPPERLAEFATTLRDRLRRLGFRIDNREFVPHVTLVRRARRRPRLQPGAVSWNIGGFALVRSVLDRSGAQYQIVDRW